MVGMKQVGGHSFHSTGCRRLTGQGSNQDVQKIFYVQVNRSNPQNNLSTKSFFFNSAGSNPNGGIFVEKRGLKGRGGLGEGR